MRLRATRLGAIGGDGLIPWTPANITTALWLDAADASTITTVSGAVSEWRDKSGNGRHVSQTEAANQPTYMLNGLNERPAIYQSSSNKILQGNPAGLAGAAAASIVCVFFQTGTSAAPFKITSVVTSPHIPFADGNAYESFMGSTRGQYNAFGATTSPTIYGVTIGGGQRILYKNGTGTLGLADTVADPNTFQVPSNSGASGLSLSEIVATFTSLSSATRQQIEGYLAHKWGLTANLPSDHPYKSVAP